MWPQVESGHLHCTWLNLGLGHSGLTIPVCIPVVLGLLQRRSIFALANLHRKLLPGNEKIHPQGGARRYASCPRPSSEVSIYRIPVYMYSVFPRCTCASTEVQVLAC